MKPNKTKIIFLDVDGVLHRGDVLRDPDTSEITTEFSLYDLFEFEPLLASLLEPYPDVKIVLSTSWITMPDGVHEVTSRMSESMLPRVIGNTFSESKLPASAWNRMRRGIQIRDYCARHGIDKSDWIALDDRKDGFDEGFEDNLIRTYPYAGLGDISALREIRSKMIQWACEASPASPGLREGLK